MNKTYCSEKDKLFKKRSEILEKLKSKKIILHTHDSWRDAIPESYLDMKQLQSQIATVI